MGVSVVVSSIDGISIARAEVLDVSFEEGAGHLVAVAKLAGKLIGLELVGADDPVHAELDEHIQGGEGVVEEEETDDDGTLGVEAEGGEQRGIVNEQGEERKNVEHVSLRNAEGLGGVAKLPVAEFMSKNSKNFLVGAVVDQGVKEGNVLLPWQAGEVGVGVAAALASIDDVEVGQRVLDAGGKVLDPGLELTVGKRGELVEHGDDEGGVGGEHEDLEEAGEEEQPEEELVTSPLDNGEEGGGNGGQEDNGEKVGLDEIGKEEANGLLVEPELLLDDKVVVELGGDVQDLLEE